MTEEAIEAERKSTDIISFHICDQVYCVDAMTVREIRGWAPCTVIPHAPPHMLGVINLRGSVIPIIDVAMRLGLESVEPTERSAIIVIEQGDKLAGLLVESVSDMLTVKQSEFQPVPDVMPNERLALVKGIIMSGDQMISYLDPELLIGTKTLTEYGDVAA